MRVPASLLLPVFLFALTTSCGEQGSSDGAAGAASGEAGSAGAAPQGGSPGAGSAGLGSSGDTGSGGTSAAGSGGTSAAGSSGTSAAGSSGASSGGATCNAAGVAGPQTPAIWIIGDSTASIYEAARYPRMGWAQPLQDYFAPACATIQNRARSGRSSKSFFDEGLWPPVRDALKAGDYVLIQFGHNDEEASDATLFTDPATTFPQYLSTYVDEALAKQATPILLTPIHRNRWNGVTIADSHGAYSVAIRELATSRELTLVDASELTKTYFERLGPAATTTTIFLNLTAGQFPNYPAGNSDNTHLQETGARAVAELILADFARQAHAIGALVKAVPVAP